MSLRMRISRLAVAIWIPSIIAIFLALKTSEEPVLEVFRNTRVESFFQELSTGNTIVFDLSVGFLVSVIFYLLVVWLPDRQRKKIIKRNFEKQYRFFKETTIGILLSACQCSNAAGLPEKLVKQSEFRNYFKEAVNESQMRWDVVLNGFNDRLLKELSIELGILLNEVSYVLNNVSIDDPDVFSFFNRLSQIAYKLKSVTLEYDEIKQVSKFLWEVFAGWDFIDGYREDDIIGVMLEKI